MGRRTHARAGYAALASALLVGTATPAFAQQAGDTTRVLPSGLFKADVRYVYATTGLRSQRGAIEGNDELADQAQVLSDLVGATSPFGSALIQYTGSAQVLVPSLFYGVTDWLSVGAVVPVFLDARVDLNNIQVETGAVGYNTDFPKDMTRQSPILSASDPRAVAGADGVKRVVTDVFGYEPLESWEGSGLSDISLVARARAYTSSRVVAGLQAGVDLPVGAPDNPDNLVDFGIGDGQWDVGGIALVDLIAGHGLTVNLRGGYTWQAPNRQRARVYESASIPLAPIEPLPDQYADLGQERRVTRDLGDVWQLGSTLRYWGDVFYAGAGYDFIVKGEDRYESDAGLHPALSVNTAYKVHAVYGLAGVDLVQSFLRGSAPAPLMFELQVSRQISSFESANLITTIATATLFFGSAESAKGAAKSP